MLSSRITLAVLLAATVPVSFAQTFTEIPNGYERAPSPHKAVQEALYHSGLLVPDEVPFTPLKPGGQPGIGMIDYDDDGDVDIFVSNGLGAAHSLLRNDGNAGFSDVATSVGVAGMSHDGGGVCFGDLDNDGDRDLLVLGIASDGHRLYRNEGGIFADASVSAGFAGPGAGASSCSMGDFDNDGYLDIVIGNTYDDWSSNLPIFAHQPGVYRHTQLYMSNGDFTFAEVGESAGLHATRGFVDFSSPARFHDGEATITWAVAAVDIDGDGDLDILHADDQGTVPPAAGGGIDRGFVHVFENDGSARFTDQTESNGLAIHGAWMGLAFADLNHDGYLDYFASNAGDYLFPFMGVPYTPGELTSRWFPSNGNGTFADPGIAGLVATPFGFGASAFDYDNDGDTDVSYFGGLDLTIAVVRDNPGVLLVNDGAGNFSYDHAAFSPSHSNRSTMGAAIGDLNGDGCDDQVTASNADSPMLAPMGLAYGSAFDATAMFAPTMVPVDPSVVPTRFVKNPGLDLLPGSLSIEVNSCATDNGWVQVRTLGSVGITTEGGVNRDGIGALVSVTPWKGAPAMRPVVGGSSHASQDSLTVGFGLGSAHAGTVEVRWPGGVRNRLYDVRHGEKVVFPEIPCSFDEAEVSFSGYLHCLRRALKELRRGASIDYAQSRRFQRSAIRAFLESRVR